MCIDTNVHDTPDTASMQGTGQPRTPPGVRTHVSTSLVHASAGELCLAAKQVERVSPSLFARVHAGIVEIGSVPVSVKITDSGTLRIPGQVCPLSRFSLVLTLMLV